MKYILMNAMLFLVALQGFTQAKKPQLMVVPSRQWCIERGYFTEFDNFGELQKNVNYQRAVDENPELKNVCTEIEGLFADRGFKITSLTGTLDATNRRSGYDFASNADRQGNGKSGTTVTNVDKFNKNIKADIFIEISWTVHSSGPGKYVTLNMDGIDVYSGKNVAPVVSTGSPSTSSPITVLLREAVLHDIDNFNTKLQAHFDDLFANGREIRVEIKKWDNWDKDFETEYNGEELGVLIKNWMAANTVKGRFTSSSETTESKLVYEQVRIPMYNENKVAIDAEDFGKQIRKFLKAAPFSIECYTRNRGLGEVIIICGQK